MDRTGAVSLILTTLAVTLAWAFVPLATLHHHDAVWKGSPVVLSSLPGQQRRGVIDTSHSATTARGRRQGPGSTVPLQLENGNPISWLQRLILSLRRRSLPKKVLFLPAPLHEKKNDTTSRASLFLLVFPGSFKRPQNYVNLCKSIQGHLSSEGIDADVGIVEYFLNVPFLLGVKEFTNVEDAIRVAASGAAPRTYNATYVLGHSLGGAAAMLQAVSYKYDGLVLLSSTCNSLGRFNHYGRSLASYPKPVLTVMGTRDGFLQYLALADELDDIEWEIDRRTLTDNDDQERAVLLEKPIVALEEVNHMHMADGIVSKLCRQSGRSDLSSDLAIEDAQDLVAKTVSDFLVGQATNSVSHQSSLLKAVRRTMTILDPYRDISKPSSVGEFLESIQTEMLNLPSDAAHLVRVSSHWHETREDFIYSKPSQTPEGGIVIEIAPQEPICLSKRVRQLSPTYAIKCKSQSAVLSGHPLCNKNKIKPKGPPLSLSELNAQTFRHVLETCVTSKQRDRYEREGRELCFLPDLIWGKSAPEWVDAPLQFTVSNTTGINNKNIANIQSPVLMTPLDTLPSKFAGMWYGKPLMPAQAYEWIVCDAFREIG